MSGVIQTLQDFSNRDNLILKGLNRLPYLHLFELDVFQKNLHDIGMESSVLMGTLTKIMSFC